MLGAVLPKIVRMGFGAIFPGCRALPGHTPDHAPASAGDNRFGAGAGMVVDCKLVVGDGRRTEEKPVGSRDSAGLGASRFLQGSEDKSLRRTKIVRARQ